MPRIPGTALHDEEAPKPDPDLLDLKVRFYESVIRHMGPHNRRDRRCKIAEANSLNCCNPKCNGVWGTGCWCCHALDFAREAEADTMRLHLELRPYVKAPEAIRQIDVRRLIETMWTFNAGNGWTVEADGAFVVFKDTQGRVQMSMPRAVYEDWLRA